MRVVARRAAAIVGGMLLGFGLGTQSTLFADPTSGGAAVAGILAGLGFGILVAATIGE
jgi:hypothetical protein